MPTQVRDAPRLEWQPASEATFYTVLMFDPDAPRVDAPTARSFVHWAVVNIPGADIELGETRRPYVGAFPQPGTGVHRYVFVLFEQMIATVALVAPQALHERVAKDFHVTGGFPHSLGQNHG